MAFEARGTALNLAQIRALSVTLRRVDKGLDKVEELLAESASGATYRFAENLSGEQRGAIRHLCRRLRAAVAKAADSLQVEREERSLPREIRREAEAVWASVRNAKGITLGGYGPLGREEATEVDRCLEGIAQGVAEILRLVPAALQTPGRSDRPSTR